MGGLKVPLIFICEINRKSNMIMHCVEFFFSLWAPPHHNYGFFMNLYSNTFYILNFQIFFLHGKIYPKLRIYRWTAPFNYCIFFCKNNNTLYTLNFEPPNTHIKKMLWIYIVKLFYTKISELFFCMVKYTQN